MLCKLIPELQEENLPAVYRRLKSASVYRTAESYGNIEARRLQGKAIAMGLPVKMEVHQKGGYLPVFEGKRALLIEDEQLSKSVAEKMIQAGVEVVEVHVD